MRVAMLVFLIVVSWGAALAADFVCANPHQQRVAVGTSVVTINTQVGLFSQRRCIRLCNSAENTGSAQLKVRVDRTDPSFGTDGGNIGDVITKGTCETYFIDKSNAPRVVATAASTELEVLECE